MKDIIESKVVCPKCKSNSITITELWHNHGITWEQVNGKFDRHDGALEPGDPFKLVGRCRPCDHNWVIRSASQIYDIAKD